MYSIRHPSCMWTSIAAVVLPLAVYSNTDGTGPQWIGFPDPSHHMAV